MSLGGGDLQVILRRIRYGFIVCDDTELCDQTISRDVEKEQRRRNLAKSKSIEIEKTDLLTLLRTEPDFILDELSHSPEWTATNVQVRRIRCETLGRLDEIKTENKAKREVQIISWQDPSLAQQTDQDVDDKNSIPSLFQRRTEPLIPLKQPSPLTAFIQSSRNQQNPFAQYAKFDGTPNVSSHQSKKFTVHFKSQKQELSIIVSSHATVQETIGYICYKYTTGNQELALTQKDPSKYFLYIADDYGEAEEDFPPLTHARPIGDYDFPHLILIEQTVPANTSVSSTPSDSDDISTDDDDEVDNENDDDASLKDSSRSETPPLPPPSTTNKPRVSISSNGKASVATVIHEVPKTIDPIDNMNRLYESLNQKSYFFDYYVKLSSSKHVKVRIDVSGEQIRLELLEKTSRSDWQTSSLSTERLVNCILLEKEANKKKDRTRVHLTFDSQQESDGSRAYQTYELESTFAQADQFCAQVVNIIQLKNPRGHETYEQQRRQHRDNSKKRRSIFNLIGGGSGNSGSASKH